MIYHGKVTREEKTFLASATFRLPPGYVEGALNEALVRFLSDQSEKEFFTIGKYTVFRRMGQHIKAEHLSALTFDTTPGAEFICTTKTEKWLASKLLASADFLSAMGRVKPSVKTMLDLTRREVVPWRRGRNEIDT